MNKLGLIFYETRPFLLLALGLYVLVSQEPSPVLVASALTLLFCAALILRLRLKARKGSAMEQFVYDLQPILYLGLGAYALVWLRSSKLAVASALVLLFCGSLILRWRMSGKS